jgi:chromate reductase
MMEKEKNILIINGSLRGEEGDGYRLALKALEYAKQHEGVHAKIFSLASQQSSAKELYELLEAADGFVVISGTYWNNISSLLQHFAEVCTAFENSPAFFGKPITALVTMDSVGGVEVANKIHHIFQGLGCWSPPCSTVVISRIGEKAVQDSIANGDDENDDVWRISDIEITIQNLITATTFPRNEWKCWPFKRLIQNS